MTIQYEVISRGAEEVNLRDLINAILISRYQIKHITRCCHEIVDEGEQVCGQELLCTPVCRCADGFSCVGQKRIRSLLLNSDEFLISSKERECNKGSTVIGIGEVGLKNRNHKSLCVFAVLISKNAWMNFHSGHLRFGTRIRDSQRVFVDHLA